MSKTAEAQESLSQAVSLLEKSGGNRNLALVFPLQTRADLYVQMKKWDEVQKDLEKVLEIEKNYYTGFGVQTADASRALGDFYAIRKLGDKSKTLYEQALKIYTNLLMGNKGYPALSLMEKAGAAYRGLERYSEALDWDTKALDVEKEIYGPGHPRMALCEARIAWDEQLMGKTQEAQAHRTEAETALKTTLGDAHPLIGMINSLKPSRDQ
jgi:tetratricopeptide (TPR) repeat protein